MSNFQIEGASLEALQDEAETLTRDLETVLQALCRKYEEHGKPAAAFMVADALHALLHQPNSVVELVDKAPREAEEQAYIPGPKAPPMVTMESVAIGLGYRSGR